MSMFEVIPLPAKGGQRGAYHHATSPKAAAVLWLSCEPEMRDRDRLEVKVIRCRPGGERVGDPRYLEVTCVKRERNDAQGDVTWVNGLAFVSNAHEEVMTLQVTEMSKGGRL